MRAKLLILVIGGLVSLVSAQLPDDIQRELNQNLEEQARIQAMRQKHQQQIQNRAGGHNTKSSVTQRPVHDPNNYSYQQISPPIQYSYYQPYGDTAQTQQPTGGVQTGGPNQKSPGVQPINFDLNNLNFELPQPQAQVSGQADPRSSKQQLVPSFTGAGGLPIMRPAAAASPQEGLTEPSSQPPLAPQARVQQGPPLTEADFKDITGGENYGSPGGSDFGLGDMSNSKVISGRSSPNLATSSDGDFGLSDDQATGSVRSPQRRNSAMNVPDFGGFNPVGAEMGADFMGQQRRRQNPSSMNEFGNFGGFGNSDEASEGNNEQDSASNREGQPNSQGSGDDSFDFNSQPSSNRGDQTSAGGGAPASLQSLLGQGFPGLGSVGSGSGFEDFTRSSGSSNNQPTVGSRSQSEDSVMDISDLGDKSDQFQGADLSGFGQPNQEGGQDFNFASASNQQPKSVPYPDSSPQPVGTLWALTQPQSLTQMRYNPLPDKGTYQDYPAYLEGGNDFSAVAQVVDETPKARRPGPGRYSSPAISELAPEYKPDSSVRYDYGQAPSIPEAGYVSRFGF